MPQKPINWDESEHPRDASGEFAEKAAAATPPPRQSLMFDANKTARLFEGAVYESTKKAKKKVAEKSSGPSLLEKIEDEVAARAAASKPLDKQMEFFSRMRDAINLYASEPSLLTTTNPQRRGSGDESDLRKSIRKAALETDRNPSDEQKEAGNYRKGKFRWNGLTIAIENPIGSIRSGVSKSGERWQVRMQSHYGYILKNISEADGDHVDVFVGPNPESDLVCVVDQKTRGGRFDEHKVMIGFTSVRDAQRAYLANYSAGWTGLESIVAMTVSQFKNWLERGDSGARISRQVSRYKKPGEKGRWVTIHGVHVYVANGKVMKGPSPLVGQRADSLKPKTGGKGIQNPVMPSEKPTPEKPADDEIQFKEWDEEEDRAWKKITIPDDIHFKEWIEEDEPEKPVPRGASRKATIRAAAQQAAEAAEVSVDDVLRLMPEAQKYLKQEQHEREKAKAALRRISGLNAGSLARLENKYRDHSSVKNWDTTSREFAANHPELGFDPDGDDTPARIWNFLRQGKSPYISAYDPKVAELAALWSSPKLRAAVSGRMAGDEDGEDSHHHVDDRSAESVPFSRCRAIQATIVRKFSRFFKIRQKMLLRGF